MAAVQATRGGTDYDSTWGKRFRGEGPIAEIIRTRFTSAVKRLNAGQRLDGEEPIVLNVSDFRPPVDPSRTDPGQLSLL